MSDNIIEFPGETTLDIPPDKILKAALKTDFEMVIVLGWTKEGHLYAAGSTSSVPETIYVLEQLKHEILSGEA